MKIGILSGFDLGFDCQLWRIKEALKKFKEEDVKFIIVAGGLIKPPDDKKELKSWEREVIFQVSKIQKFINEIGFFVKGKPVKLWIRTCRYLDYRNKYKEEDFKELFDQISSMSSFVIINPDCMIKVESSFCRRIYIKGPESSVPFAVKVSSAPIEHEIWKELSRGDISSIPDFGVVGGFGVYIYECKPRSFAGHLQFPYVSIPSLHIRKEKGYIVQNVQGYSILNIDEENKRYEIETYFYDYDEIERRATLEYYQRRKLPKSFLKVLEAVLDIQKSSIPLTVGLVSDYSGQSRDIVLKVFEKLGLKTESSIVPHFEDLQEIKLPEETSKERLIATACMHVGSLYTDYTQKDKIIKEASRHRVGRIIIVGDIIEGTKYALKDSRLEQGMETNFIQQYAAVSIIKDLASSTKELVIIPGNHDVWVRDDFYEILNHFKNKAIFRDFIRIFNEELYKEIQALEQNIPVFLILKREIKSDNVVIYDDQPVKHDKLWLKHEFKGGSKSTTYTLENGLSDMPRECDVLILGNYHELTSLAKKIGGNIVVGLLVGTWKRKDPFEAHLGKVSETGSWFLELSRDEAGRILKIKEFIIA